MPSKVMLSENLRQFSYSSPLAYRYNGSDLPSGEGKDTPDQNHRYPAVTKIGNKGRAMEDGMLLIMNELEIEINQLTASSIIWQNSICSGICKWQLNWQMGVVRG
jgi:hypothetical protein